MQETLPLPDQVDVTINYIKTMKEKLEKMKHEREELMMMKNKAQSRKMHSCASSSLSSHLHHDVEPHPQIHIHEMGPAMAVVFITGLDNVATFNNVIRVVRGEEGVEVTSASFQLHGNSTLQIVGEPVIIYFICMHFHTYDILYDLINKGLRGNVGYMHTNLCI